MEEKPRAYDFGPYRLELPTHRLLRKGEPVALTPKAFDTLLALVERADRVVDKSELIRLVWPDSIVEESNLSQTIFVLRKTLGEGPNGEPFIETVPRRGYRFVAAVSREPDRTSAAPESAPPPAPRPAAASRRPVLAIAAAAVLVALVVWAGVVRDLWLDASPTGIESVVVLPLANLSGDPEQEYLADGMTDALITNLGQINRLRVISRTSAMTYKGTGKTLPQIARELRVDAAIEGSVQRVGERLRLNLTLIDAAAERPLWSQSYERDLQHAIELQNEAARAIAAHIAIRLTPREQSRLAEAPRVNPRVYEAHLKGRYFWNRRSNADVRRAIELFEEALRHDPGYAPAYAGLADSYYLLGTYGWMVPGADAWARAIAAAERALELDDSLADGHTSRAAIAATYEWDWDRAERGYQRALELNPGYAQAHHWYGYHLMLLGRLDEAERELRRALELDPLSPIIDANIGFRLYAARQYDAAIEHWNKARELHPNYRLLHSYAGMAYVGKEMYAEAVAEFEKAYGLAGGGPSERAVLAHTYARMGREREARAVLSELQSPAGTTPVPAYYIAIIYVGLGENERAVDWLEKAYNERSGPLNELSADPMFDRLRGNLRFDALTRRIGLPVHAGPPQGTAAAR